MVNYLAILISAIVCMIIGFIWFNHKLFGKQFRKLVHWDKKMEAGLKKDGVKPHMLALIAFLLLGFVFAKLMELMGIYQASTGGILGLIIALGFTITTGLIDYLYARRPSKLFIMNYAYYAICIIITGIIIGGMS